MVNGSQSKNLDVLIVMGTMGKKEKRHQRKVLRFKELMEMRIERKKKIKDLMAKRAGNYTKWGTEKV